MSLGRSGTMAIEFERKNGYGFVLYRMYDISSRSSLVRDDLERGYFADEYTLRVYRDIIRQEQPISFTNLSKRVAPLYGGGKTTEKLVSCVKGIVRRQLRDDTVIYRDEFVCFSDYSEVIVRYRTEDGYHNRDIGSICHEELMQALKDVVTYRRLSEEDLLKETTRALGFQKMGRTIQKRLLEALRYMENRGDITIRGTVQLKRSYSYRYRMGDYAAKKGTSIFSVTQKNKVATQAVMNEKKTVIQSAEKSQRGNDCICSSVGPRVTASSETSISKEKNERQLCRVIKEIDLVQPVGRSADRIYIKLPVPENKLIGYVFRDKNQGKEWRINYEDLEKAFVDKNNKPLWMDSGRMWEFYLDCSYSSIFKEAVGGLPIIKLRNNNTACAKPRSPAETKERNVSVADGEALNKTSVISESASQKNNVKNYSGEQEAKATVKLDTRISDKHILSGAVVYPCGFDEFCSVYDITRTQLRRFRRGIKECLFVFPDGRIISLASKQLLDNLNIYGKVKNYRIKIYHSSLMVEYATKERRKIIGKAEGDAQKTKIEVPTVVNNESNVTTPTSLTPVPMKGGVENKEKEKREFKSFGELDALVLPFLGNGQRVTSLFRD